MAASKHSADTADDEEEKDEDEENVIHSASAPSSASADGDEEVNDEVDEGEDEDATDAPIKAALAGTAHRLRSTVQITAVSTSAPGEADE